MQMSEWSIVQISAYPGWIVGVSHSKTQGYQCWVINPNLDVLSNKEIYYTSSAAMAAGRNFVERSR